MEHLTRTEEILLLAVYELKDNAYGITIREHVENLMGRRFSIGGIYVPLDRLTKRRLLTSFDTEPTPERGGRRKRIFRITSDGVKALREARSLHERMWAKVPRLVTPRVKQIPV